MSFKRMLFAALIAIGIGLNGLLGVGVTVAGAAPTTGESPDPQPVPGVTLNHHDQKKLKKYLKEHPEVTLPSAAQR